MTTKISRIIIVLILIFSLYGVAFFLVRIPIHRIEKLPSGGFITYYVKRIPYWFSGRKVLVNQGLIKSGQGDLLCIIQIPQIDVGAYSRQLRIVEMSPSDIPYFVETIDTPLSRHVDWKIIDKAIIAYSEKAVPYLTPLIESEQLSIQTKALELLSKIDCRDISHLPVVIKAIRSLRGKPVERYDVKQWLENWIKALDSRMEDIEQAYQSDRDPIRYFSNAVENQELIARLLLELVWQNANGYVENDDMPVIEMKLIYYDSFYNVSKWTLPGSKSNPFPMYGTQETSKRLASILSIYLDDIGPVVLADESPDVFDLTGYYVITTGFINILKMNNKNENAGWPVIINRHHEVTALITERILQIMRSSNPKDRIDALRGIFYNDFPLSNLDFLLPFIEDIDESVRLETIEILGGVIDFWYGISEKAPSGIIVLAASFLHDRSIIVRKKALSIFNLDLLTDGDIIIPDAQKKEMIAIIPAFDKLAETDPDTDIKMKAKKIAEQLRIIVSD